MVKDQDEIVAAIAEDNPMKVWQHVKFIGYKNMPSIHNRKLVFYRAYKDFDPEVNDNFVWFYTNCVKYQSMIDWKKKTSALTCDRSAIQRKTDKSIWPIIGENSNQKPKNQNENILDRFIY